METQAGSPVMDVKAPPAREPKAQEVVAQAPPEEKATQDTKSEAKAEVKKDSKNKNEVHTQAKSTASNNGVGMAITATVIIVLGLAAIATYAYLQQ